MKNNHNNNKNRWVIPSCGIVLLAVTLLIWPLSHIANWGWNWGFTEPSIMVLILMGIALLLFPFLSEFSLPGGIVFKLRQELAEVQDALLTGEVVFNREEKGGPHLFWIDGRGKKRRLPNLDTASLFATPKGFIGISQDRFNRIEEGPDIPALTKDSFRHTAEDNLFAILDGKIFYLSSLSLPFKYGWKGRLGEMSLITDEDFRHNQIFR